MNGFNSQLIKNIELCKPKVPFQEEPFLSTYTDYFMNMSFAAAAENTVVPQILTIRRYEYEVGKHNISRPPKKIGDLKGFRSRRLRILNSFKNSSLYLKI
jgi:hypothetical protein